MDWDKDKALNSLRPTNDGQHFALRPRNGGWHFADDIFKHIMLNEKCILIVIAQKCVPIDQIASIVSVNGLAPAQRQAIAWTNGGHVYWCTYASMS